MVTAVESGSGQVPRNEGFQGASPGNSSGIAFDALLRMVCCGPRDD